MRGKQKEQRKSKDNGISKRSQKNKKNRKIEKGRDERTGGTKQGQMRGWGGEAAESNTHQRDRRRCREEELSSPAYSVSEKQQTVLE